MPNIISRQAGAPPIMRMERRTAGRAYHSKQWYYRASICGRVAYFPLGDDVNKARSLAIRIRGFVRSGVTSLEEAREKFCADLLARKKRRVRNDEAARDVPHVSTIGQVFDVLCLEQESLELKSTSRYAYENSLTIVVETVLSEQDRGFKRESVRDQPLNILTGKLLNDFKRIRSRNFAVIDELAKKSAKRTINKHLRNSKAIFKKTATETYREAGLIVPDLSEFLGASLFGKVGVEYQLPRADLIRSVAHAILHELAGNEQLAAMLALHAGLRADEIGHARWSWLNTDSSTTPYLRVQPEHDFDTKNHRSRNIPLEPWFAAWLKARSCEDSPHVLTGGTVEREDDAFRRLAHWLRQKGICASKPMHELRKWFGSFAVHSTRSFPRAQKMLGHRSAQTTNDYYADLEFSPALGEVWTKGDISTPHAGP